MSAGLAVHPPRREAWIIEWPEDAFLLSPICDEHADALSVPAGWLLHDERGADSGLFDERSVAAQEQTATVHRLDHRRARRQVTVEEPTLFDTSTVEDDPAIEHVAAAEATTDREPDEPSEAAPGKGGSWIGDPDERHTELLEVDGSTPLLARAFRASQAS